MAVYIFSSYKGWLLVHEHRPMLIFHRLCISSFFLLRHFVVKLTSSVKFFFAMLIFHRFCIFYCLAWLSLVLICTLFLSSWEEELQLVCWTSAKKKMVCWSFFPLPASLAPCPSVSAPKMYNAWSYDFSTMHDRVVECNLLWHEDGLIYNVVWKSSYA